VSWCDNPYVGHAGNNIYVARGMHDESTDGQSYSPLQRNDSVLVPAAQWIDADYFPR